MKNLRKEIEELLKDYELTDKQAQEYIEMIIGFRRKCPYDELRKELLK